MCSQGYRSEELTSQSTQCCIQDFCKPFLALLSSGCGRRVVICKCFSPFCKWTGGQVTLWTSEIHVLLVVYSHLSGKWFPISLIWCRLMIFVLNTVKSFRAVSRVEGDKINGTWVGMFLRSDDQVELTLIRVTVTGAKDCFLHYSHE